MIRTDNLNIEQVLPHSPPETVRAEIPITARAADTVVAGRADIENILSGRDRRLLVVAGPCSIHSLEETIEYAVRLRRLAESIGDRLVPVMRVYFEKPRTLLGWKGLIYDPHLNGSDDIEAGVRLARRILLAVAETGLPAATEILEPVIPQYLTDLVAWATIGARTAESQTHRQMASGLSMPIGFKNGTDGSLKIAVEAIKTASSPHAFIGITGDGRIGVFRTRGNPFGHLVLRGGFSGPNYTSEYVAFARELLRKAGLVPNILVDCSHANSGKEPRRQPAVLRDVVAQIVAGDTSLKGVMLESYLETGRQEIPAPGAPLVPGLSVTDSCLGWADTEAALREAYAALAPLFRR